jgi:hypothetical protein
MLLPLQCGGGPDEPTKAYLVLRSAEGKGGSAPNDSGIDGLWRRSIALGLASGTSAVRRAFVNALPMFATDLLPYYERSLGTSQASRASDAERREAVSVMWPTRASATLPSLRTELLRIDSRFAVEMVPEQKTSASWDGRWFGAMNNTVLPAFGPSQNYSEVASPTTRCMITAFLDVDEAVEFSQRDLASIEKAERRLRTLVPSWVDFAVSVSDGLTLDESPLDWTVLSDE